MKTAIVTEARLACSRARRCIGHLAALVMLAGCASAAAPSALVARKDFARERYCPLRRVSAAEVDVTPPARPEIARDRERLAMWRWAARGRVAGTHWVGVEGCDERAEYICRDEIVRESMRRRGKGVVVVGSVCLEQGLPIPEVEASTGAP